MNGITTGAPCQVYFETFFFLSLLGTRAQRPGILQLERLWEGRNLVLVQPEPEIKKSACPPIHPKKWEHSMFKLSYVQMCAWLEFQPLFLQSALKSKSVSHSVMLNSLQPHGLQPARLLCPCDSAGKNFGLGRHSLLQGVFPTQGSNTGLLHCRQLLYRCCQHEGELKTLSFNQRSLLSFRGFPGGASGKEPHLPMQET